MSTIDKIIVIGIIILMMGMTVTLELIVRDNEIKNDKINELKLELNKCKQN